MRRGWLVGSKTHLDAQLQRLHFLRTFVKNRKNRNWPVASQSEQVKIADETARDLLEGYDHLVHRVTALSKRCSDSTMSLMNQSMLEESRNAISQARIVGRLTLLAFFFIPLSFTTSFFGMNVRELAEKDGPKMSVWLWFVVTAPIFLISLAVCFWSTIEPHLRRWSEYFQRNLGKSVQ
jgi:Mg2+ and Co2+ transporter CorA